MYSVVKGEVVVHRLPFDANEPLGVLKLQKFLSRGFTYDDPRKGRKTGMPNVIVTQTVDLEKLADVGEVKEEGLLTMPPLIDALEVTLITTEASIPQINIVPTLTIQEKRVAALAKARANEIFESPAQKFMRIRDESESDKLPPPKKWRNMNAAERKEYQAKKATQGG